MPMMTDEQWFRMLLLPNATPGFKEESKRIIRRIQADCKRADAELCRKNHGTASLAAMLFEREADRLDPKKESHE